MLAVDCAYAEFAECDLTQTALKLPNAIVFRTVSKALGLAGLRIGYALGQACWTDVLRQVGMPYPVSALSIAVATNALRQKEKRQSFIDQVKIEREAMIPLLTECGMEPQPSDGNFVFARTQKSVWWRDTMAALGISIRARPLDERLGDAVRITCPGTKSDFERLRAALKTISKPEALLFDLDGVLADVSTSYRTAIIQTAASYGVSITRTTLNGSSLWVTPMIGLSPNAY